MEALEVDQTQELNFSQFKNQVLSDYKWAVLSRQASVLGRREVLTGKAKFGIFGGGKELPQLAMARVFKNGDFRSGYYRDQTFMFAIGQLTLQSFFAQLYALTDLEIEPAAGGRQMTSHFSTKSLNEDGSWRNLTEQKNSSSDISPTAGQMPRLLGLAQASKMYRAMPEMDPENKFSREGNEIAFGTIGDASTSEGHFWEVINAAGVLQVPMVLSIWDDEYGISVPAGLQRTKWNLTEMLEGFRKTETQRGFEILTVKGWDYPALIQTYEQAEEMARKWHVPVIIHVQECTQPQGHSTSGSHERYKSEERLQWENEHDGLKKFKSWILDYYYDGDRLATEEELNEIESYAKKEIKEVQKETWEIYLNPIRELRTQLLEHISGINSNILSPINNEIEKLKSRKTLFKKDVFGLARKVVWETRNHPSEQRTNLVHWLKEKQKIEERNYSSHLHSESDQKIQNVPQTEIQYANEPEMVDGRIVLRDNFDRLFSKYNNLVTFGEDSGGIGDVNQGLQGLQEKYGSVRISDTGIREASIIGQGIGLAMRGLRPIAEIQYLDYLLYGLQIISDDLATVLYRTVGQQKAPLIVRTRGHRLEGIWHAGSPMGGVLNLVRGINLLVPRNLTKAAGFYNTLLQSDEPAIVIESLNGYRLKEKMPLNLGEFTLPIGEVEITKEGTDVTLVTYGSTWRIVTSAAEELAKLGVDAEVIDIQSLLPFDLNHNILKSVQKTNRLVVIDEDVPGGGTAYILQKVLEEQGAYHYLDSKPISVTAKAHRAAYATDGDYFSKPSLEDVVEAVYGLMNEARPNQFPELF